LSLAQPQVCFRGEAEVDRRAKRADPVENDPYRTQSVPPAAAEETFFAEAQGVDIHALATATTHCRKRGQREGNLGVI
jgi:hypothetical protein